MSKDLFEKAFHVINKDFDENCKKISDFTNINVEHLRHLHEATGILLNAHYTTIAKLAHYYDHLYHIKYLQPSRLYQTKNRMLIKAQIVKDIKPQQKMLAQDKVVLALSDNELKDYIKTHESFRNKLMLHQLAKMMAGKENAYNVINNSYFETGIYLQSINNEQHNCYVIYLIDKQKSRDNVERDYPEMGATFDYIISNLINYKIVKLQLINQQGQIVENKSDMILPNYIYGYDIEMPIEYTGDKQNKLLSQTPSSNLDQYMLEHYQATPVDNVQITINN